MVTGKSNGLQKFNYDNACSVYTYTRTYMFYLHMYIMVIYDAI